MTRKYFSLILTFVLLVSGLVLMGCNDKEAEAKESPWQVRCDDLLKDGEPAGQYCEMFYKVVVQESGKTFFDFAIGVPEKGKPARGKVLLPLGILLNEPVRMQLDSEDAMTFSVRYCDPKGCHAFLSLNDQVIKAFSKGENGLLSFVAANGQRLNVPISLEGFTAAYKKVK